MSRPWLFSSTQRILRRGGMRRRTPLRSIIMGRQHGKTYLTSLGSLGAQSSPPDMSPRPWSRWRMTITLFPRKSVYGKWVVGRIYRRGRKKLVWKTAGMGGYLAASGVEKEFLSKKEMFKWKLENSE